MGFVGVMLFTQQDFHLECLFFFLLVLILETVTYYFGLNLSHVLLIKVLFIKKACNFVIWSSKNKRIALPHEFIFMFIRYFSGAILSKKSCQKRGVWKNIKRGRGWSSSHIGGLPVQGAVGQTFCTLCWRQDWQTILQAFPDFISSNNTDIFRELLTNNVDLFRAHIKQYSLFYRVIAKQ